MSTACGKLGFSPKLFRRLALLGQALDEQHQLCVFDGGLVGFDLETESEVIQNVAQGKAHRSEAGSRSRRRTSSDSWRRSPGNGYYLSSEAHKRAFGTELQVLAQHYDARGLEDQHGLWVTLKSNPLGWGGPQVNLLVGVLADRRVQPRAWAFQDIGLRAKPFPLRHTNFPDASVCAFIPEDDAWSPASGLLGLADHLTIWAVKKLHYQNLGWWPGPQFGFGALYRRLEFQPQEWCGCRSGKRYGNCHRASDLLADQNASEAEFLRAFLTNYEDRAYPLEIDLAARSRWKTLPTLRSAFSHRPIRVDYPDFIRDEQS